MLLRWICIIMNRAVSFSMQIHWSKSMNHKNITRKRCKKNIKNFKNSSWKDAQLRLNFSVLLSTGHLRFQETRRMLENLNGLYLTASINDLLANKILYSIILYLVLQWNPDFSNLQGKRKLVREIGSSRNRRWHQITPNWPGIVWL